MHNHRLLPSFCPYNSCMYTHIVIHALAHTPRLLCPSRYDCLMEEKLCVSVDYNHSPHWSAVLCLHLAKLTMPLCPGSSSSTHFHSPNPCDTQHPKHNTNAARLRPLNEHQWWRTNLPSRYFSSPHHWYTNRYTNLVIFLVTCSLLVSGNSTAHTFVSGVTSINTTAVKVLH